MSFGNSWFVQIKKASEAVMLDYAYLIVDQAGDFYKLHNKINLVLPDHQWCSLLEEEPEGGYLDECPLLVQVDLNNKESVRWFSSIINEHPEFERFLLFFSRYGFSTVAPMCKKLIIADWAGNKGVFRFYDARIFPKLARQILSEEQKNMFFCFAHTWSWCNRNGVPQWYGYDVSEQSSELQDVNVKLTDWQVERIGLVSDIEAYMSARADMEAYDKEQVFEYLWCESQKQEDAVIDFNQVMTRYMLVDSESAE